MLPLLLLAATPDAALVTAAAGALERSELPPERERVAQGLIDLVEGRRSSARLALDGSVELAVYRAMAELDGPGGIGRAREVLAKAAESPDAPAGALFLGALAFQASGARAKADALLVRALARAPSALDDAFAPDPAAALVRLVASSAPQGEKRRLARALLDAGRRSAAIALADSIDAREILVDAWAPIDPRRALRFADDAEWKARLHWRLDEKDQAKRELAEMKGESASMERLRAEVLLDAQRPSEALDAAQEAARLDPKSDDAVRLVAEALLATRAYDRAAAFAEELLRRRPLEIDPFGLLARIDVERKRAREVPALEARSKGHRQEREKLDKARRRREAILSAVRDAEGGLGVTGLEAVRTADPTLSLPIDLALARLGRSGTARAARDRILATCAADLKKLLSHPGAWDRVEVDVSPYGRAQKAEAPLSAADPGRCGGRVLKR